MRSAFQKSFVLGSLILLQACGAKEEVIKTEVVASKKESVPQFSGPPSGRGEANEKTFLQIACESSSQIALPNSLQPLGTRNRERISSDGRISMVAPLILGVNNRVARLLWIQGGQFQWVDYSFSTLEETSPRQVLGAVPLVQGGLENWFGRDSSRMAAVSPAGNSFVVLQKDRVEFRSVENPREKLGEISLKGSFANPRWIVRGQREEIYLDRVSNKSQSQVVLQLNANGSLQKILELPKAKFAYQLGLRVWNGSELIWMEWSEKKQLVRLWDGKSKKTRDFEVPLDWKPGPGFALSESNQVVMQSALGIFYGELLEGRVNYARKLEYSPTVEDNIRRGIYEWRPGQIFSSANNKQLFVVLPNTFGRMLYAIDEGRFFRKLGEERCENPDFYPVFE